MTKVVEALDYSTWWLLVEVHFKKEITYPNIKTVREALANSLRAAAISRLLDLGAIRTSYLDFTPGKYTELKDSTAAQILSYRPTEFGTAVFEEGLRRIGILSPEMQSVLEPECEGK